MLAEGAGAYGWLLPAAKELYAHREAGLSLWEKLLAKILGDKSRIAIVGPGGIGKTVLLDNLTGAAAKAGYQPPAQSRKAESGSTKSLRNRLALVVAPGQGGAQLDTYSSVFDPKNPVDGVVFVAGAGFVSIRDQLAEKAVVAKGIDTIRKWRDLNIAEEIRYLRELLVELRQTKAQSRRPRWMLVVVTKIDLFYDELDTVKEYYSPHIGSEFSSLINDFQAQVGADNFTWDAVPVCSLLNDFGWNGEVAKSLLDSPARDHYIAQMVKRMGELCH